MADVLDNLEISVRTTNVLRAYGVKTIDDFMALTRPAVLKLQYAGSKTWREIAEVQEGLGRDNAPTQAVNLLNALNSLDLREDYFFCIDKYGQVQLAKYIREAGDA